MVMVIQQDGQGKETWDEEIWHHLILTHKLLFHRGPWPRPLLPDCEDIGVKPGTDDVLLSGDVPGGEKILGRCCEEAPFNIEGARVVPKGLVTGGWVIPIPCGVGCRWGSIIGQN